MKLLPAVVRGRVRRSAVFGKTLGKEKNFRSLVAFGKAALLFQYKPIQKYLLTAYSIYVEQRRISYRRAKKIWPVPTESNTSFRDEDDRCQLLIGQSKSWSASN